jgi:hypothetical protein
MPPCSARKSKLFDILTCAQSGIRDDDKAASKGKTICVETDTNLSLVCLYC